MNDTTHNIRFSVRKTTCIPNDIEVTLLVDSYFDGSYSSQSKQILPVKDPVKLILALRDAANQLEKLV